LPVASWIQIGFGSYQGLHPGTSQDMTKFTKLDPTSKFTEIHNSHASYDKIQHHHLTQGGNASPKEECNNINKIHGQGGEMQKFMDKEECKNSWIRRNAKIS
jgi:hypothetical protein